MTNILDKAHEIATHLGDGWVARADAANNGRGAYLHGPDDEELHVRAGTRSQTSGRIEIVGSLDIRHQRHDEPHHFITVAPDKAPARVAGDIMRRLLPDYREGLTLARKRKADREQWEAKKAQMVTILSGILPGAQKNERAPDMVVFGGGKYRDRGIGGEARVLSSDSVEWTIRTDETETRELAELIYATSNAKDK